MFRMLFEGWASFLMVASCRWGQERFERDIYRISKVIDKKLLTLDLLIVNPLLQQAFEAREYYEWQGVRLQAVSPAGLYVMKKLAGRPQDIADLQRLGMLPDDSAS